MALQVVFNQRVGLYFSILPYSGAQTEALWTIMVLAVDVGVAKTISFSYTIVLFTCPTRVGFRPTVLDSSFCISIKFYEG